jgi:DDE superfamily endonuclease.
MSLGHLKPEQDMNYKFYRIGRKHFIDYTTPTDDDPILLILDNHLQHCSFEAVTFCRQHYITLLSLPPHSTHKLQLLY